LVSAKKKFEEERYCLLHSDCCSYQIPPDTWWRDARKDSALVLKSGHGSEKRSSWLFLLLKAQMQQKHPGYSYIPIWKVKWSWDTLQIYHMILDLLSHKIHSFH